MSGAATALQAGGAGLSAYSQYKEGLANQSYYKYLAANSRTEEALVQQQADQEINSQQTEGAYETKMAGRKTAELEGSQAATEAANGVAGSVTAADIAKDTFDKAKMDQLAIKYNADVASWRTRTNANLKKYALENEAKNYEYAGANANREGKLGAVSSILGGASQVASSASSFSKNAPSKGRTARSSAVGGGRSFPIGSGEY